METESSDERENVKRTTEQKGRPLRPSTIGVLKEALQHYLARERDFVDAYFPEVAERGYTKWGDLFGLTDDQADALRPIMVESIHHFWRQDGAEKNRRVNLLNREPDDPGFVSFPARKAKFWTEALRDLCRVYAMECPL
jgi:hypothetical protein